MLLRFLLLLVLALPLIAVGQGDPDENRRNYYKKQKEALEAKLKRYEELSKTTDPKAQAKQQVEAQKQKPTGSIDSDDPYNDPNLQRPDAPFGDDAKGKALEATAEQIEKMINEKGTISADMLNELQKKFVDKDVMAEMIKQNQESLATIKDEDLEMMIYSKMPPFAQNIFKKYPKLVTFVVKFMKDKEALPSLMSGFANKQKRYIYLGCLIATLLLAVWLKRRNRWKKQNFFVGVFKSIMISIAAIFLNLAVFGAVFYNELSPSIKIAKEVYKS